MHTFMFMIDHLFDVYFFLEKYVINTVDYIIIYTAHFPPGEINFVAKLVD